MAYCYVDKDLKNLPTMKRFRVRTTDGKVKVATKSHKIKLPTVKETEAKIKAIDERIEKNEAAFAKKQITGTVYDDTRETSRREREILLGELETLKRMSYVGESIEFLGYVDQPRKEN